MEIEQVTALLNTALASQVTQFGVAFSIAAYIHSGRMKKEISTQMSQISGAVNNLATALRQDLSSQDKRIGEVESDIVKIKTTQIIREY